MDDYQANRSKAFSPYVTPKAKGIEIGPGYRPTFPKAQGYAVTIVDHCSTEQLIAKYEMDKTIPDNLVRQIEPVDIVWSGGSYSDLPGLAGNADYVAAAHVIEHANDVCGFLQDCSAMLKFGGLLLLAIPDRSYVLDCYRPPSTLGDVLLAHVAPHAYDIKSRLDEAWHGALLDGGGAWSPEHMAAASAGGRIPTPQHPLSLASHVWSSFADRPLDESARPYRDAHRWVFDPINFAEIVDFLALNADTKLQVESMPGRYGCEFYAVLRKVAAESIDGRRVEFNRTDALRARRTPIYRA